MVETCQRWNRVTPPDGPTFEPQRAESYIRSTRARLFLLVLLVVSGSLIASGCGGDDEDSGQASTPAASTERQSDTPSLTEAEAEELATSMLLRLTDFPTGWRAQPSEDEEGCAGVEELTERYDALAKVDSDDFVHGEATQVGSGAALFNDEETGREALNYLEGAIQSEEFEDCLNDYLSEQADENVTFGDVQVGQVSFPSLGDRSSAWEVAIPAESQGFSITAYVDAVYILESNALSAIVFTDVASPPDEQMREDLSRLVAQRMGEAVDEIP